jgi:hypothetical protein
MKKNRNILLIEPKYRNKYPPIGLMKIATYHKMLGDNVKFFKGDLKDLVLDQMTEDCISKFYKIDNFRDWKFEFNTIRSFIKTRKNEFLDILLSKNEKDESLQKYSFLVENAIRSYAHIYRKKEYENFPKWDRVYVTTLFTFYWKITVEAIHYAKHLVKNQDQIMLGGVLASLLHKEVEEETGIRPHEGLLDKPGMLDPDLPKAKKLVVDNLPLDYSILDEIDYVYPTGSAYFTFMTKGCTRKCAFCSVPILEPTYKPKIDTLDKFAEIKEIYGEQQHLLLMDNNVLASPKFPEIIQEIKDMGFYKGATYIEPNQLDIAIKNLKNGLNDKAYIKRSYRLLHGLLKKLRNKRQQNFYDVLDKHKLIKLQTTTKGGILMAYEEVKETFERYRSKAPKQRFVDFNQGTDARYVTDELMKLMSEIPIRPLRIAFDYWGMKKQYESAVRLAAKYDIKELSNYILYNFKDSPEELYNRLKLNVDLGEELDIHIFSFPMKYIPLFGEEAKDRKYIGKKWNRKYIRAVQSVLNVTKGIVAPGRSFFEEAFGKDLNEFQEILHMPETLIIYRHFFRDLGITDEWRNAYYLLNVSERKIAFELIESNEFNDWNKMTNNSKILQLLKFYNIKREDVKGVKEKDLNYKKTKHYFDKLIKEDQFKDLTLTYDFEAEVAKIKRPVTV